MFLLRFPFVRVNLLCNFLFVFCCCAMLIPRGMSNDMCRYDFIICRFGPCHLVNPYMWPINLNALLIPFRIIHFIFPRSYCCSASHLSLTSALFALLARAKSLVHLWQIGESRFDNCERIRYTRDQLMQLREVRHLFVVLGYLSRTEPLVLFHKETDFNH